jgi:hypothetical protein
MRDYSRSDIKTIKRYLARKIEKILEVEWYELAA